MHAISFSMLVTVRYVIKRHAKSSSFLGIQTDKQIATKPSAPLDSNL